jgi:hypothetical protein
MGSLGINEVAEVRWEATKASDKKEVVTRLLTFHDRELQRLASMPRFYVLITCQGWEFWRPLHRACVPQHPHKEIGQECCI